MSLSGAPKEIRAFTLLKGLPSNRALRLAVLAGLSSLCATFVIGYLVQVPLVPRTALSSAHLFWLTYVAGPLAVGTLLGVLLSRTPSERSISGGQMVMMLSLLPLVALFTFLVAYLIISGFYSRYTPAAVASIFTLAHISVVAVVRWSLNLFWRHKKA